MQYDNLNKYVLRLFLKAVTVSDDRMSTGRLFHEPKFYIAFVLTRQ